MQNKDIDKQDAGNPRAFEGLSERHKRQQDFTIKH